MKCGKRLHRVVDESGREIQVAGDSLLKCECGKLYIGNGRAQIRPESQASAS